FSFLATEFNNLYHPEFLQDIFIKYEYHYLNVTKVGTFTVHNSLSCALKCLGNPLCLSVNLAASKGADGKFWCELLSSEKYSNPKMYKGNKSSHHLTIMSPCLSSPCQNGGICTADFKNHAKSTMIECRCKGGFSGKFCERGNNCALKIICGNGQPLSRTSFFANKPFFSPSGSNRSGRDNQSMRKHCWHGQRSKFFSEINGRWEQGGLPASILANPLAICCQIHYFRHCLHIWTRVKAEIGRREGGGNWEPFHSYSVSLAHSFSFVSIKCNNCNNVIRRSLRILPEGSLENLKCDSLVNRLKETRLVTLLLDSNLTTVLCHMGDFGCGDGGWTPVMKMDGNKRTFHFDSRYWTNKETVTPDGGKTGFDLQETKLPSYWNTSFSKICLGMRIKKQSRFIVIKRTASSLHSLIADGKYRNTSLGRDTWKSLIGSEASMQFNCNREGFNARSDKQYYPGRDQSKARIGILGNNENDCGQCDSRIGFGTGGVHDDSNTCRNEANIYPLDNGHKHIKAMGYILVQ
ncbi:unnamed protein product, partial [Porites evermanni]